MESKNENSLGLDWNQFLWDWNGLEFSSAGLKYNDSFHANN